MKNVIWILSASLLTLSAHADVACEAIKSEQAGKATLRGVRVTNLGKTYVREQLFGDERAALYFGSDTGSRDRAGKLCWEILNATRCDSRTPKTQDQYANHGDPGFGPALWQKDSTKAATLRVEGVSKEVQQYIGKSLETRDGEYFKYYSACEDFRAGIALDLLKSLKAEYDRKHAPASEPSHFQPVKIYEKF